MGIDDVALMTWPRWRGPCDALLGGSSFAAWSEQCQSSVRVVSEGCGLNVRWVSDACVIVGLGVGGVVRVGVMGPANECSILGILSIYGNN